jgi:murein L,D-transpeptidase YcbB/YkuD
MIRMRLLATISSLCVLALVYGSAFAQDVAAKEPVAPAEAAAAPDLLIIIETPPPPPFSLAILEPPRLEASQGSEGEKVAPSPSPEPAEAPIVIDTPPPTPFSLAILEPEKPAEPERPIIIETPPPPPFSLAILEPPPPDVRPPVRLEASAEQLRQWIEPHRARLRLRADIAEQIVAVYAARDGQAIWLDADGRLLPRARAAIEVFALAADDGLDPARFLSIAPALNAEPSARSQADVLLSLAATAYAQDARGGRLEPHRLSAMLTPELHLPRASAVLGPLSRAQADDEVREVLQSFQPQHSGYRALRAKLAELRAERQRDPAATASIEKAAVPLARLPDRFMEGGGLMPGQSDPRVPFLRLRLGLPEAEGSAYDPPLVASVIEFQRANGLKPDGRVTPRTRALLEERDRPATREGRRAIAGDERIPVLIANMERWRWLPPELGETHVFVNIPEFRLEMKDDGVRVFETRVIVGKPERQTPVFSDQMEFLVMNPSWFIPPTILRKDVLPKLAADPGYAARMGYEVIRRGNSISVRQPPGERNALGHVKFMFPNNHAVYLHDTPGRHLFRSEARAFSSGCVRVEYPMRLAEQLLLKRQGFTERALRGMVGGGERTIHLTQRVPVHLAYFTLRVGEGGELQQFNDLYGHDARIRRALSL